MNRSESVKWLISLALVVGSATAEADSAPAGANESSAAASAPSADQATEGPAVLNEVVVTATRRSERLQDVPISISALSQDQLTQMGIIGVEGIARDTPGVVFDNRSDNNFSVTTRGISTNGYQAGLQSTTTVYLDDIPLTTIGEDPEQWAAFGKIAAQANSAADWGAEKMTKYFNPVVLALIDLLKKAMPDCDEATILWGYHFVSGAMMHNLARTGRLDDLSHGLCSSADFESIKLYMARFMAAGFQAICRDSATRK
jgi:hypothetical protein